MEHEYEPIELSVRPMTETERMYSYTQSIQILAQTGCIGHLRGDMDTDGNGFFTSWNDHRDYLKTAEFKEEFDKVINNLRFNKAYGGMLACRDALRKYCESHPESSYGNGPECGFRADTDKYTYMLRLNPNKGEYNLYIYCYVKSWLDKHMQNAEKGIRFIRSDYTDLFCIADGGKIRVNDSGGFSVEYTCRYIDDYHAEIGNHLYHICEFAEDLESRNAKPEPVSPVLEKPLSSRKKESR